MNLTRAGLRRSLANLAAATALLVAGHPSPAQDPTPAAEAAAAFAPFDGSIGAADVTRDMLGKDMAVSGTVVEYSASRGERSPNRVILHQADGATFMLVYWPDVATAVEHGMGPLTAGTRVSAKGKIQEYQGALQIRITDPAAIRIEGRPGAAPAAAATRARQAAPQARPAVPAHEPPPLKPGEMTTLEDVMRRTKGNVMFEAEVVAYRAAWSPSAPNVLTVTDGVRSIDVISFPNNVPSIDEALKQPGAKVRITGRRSDYRGRQQVVISRMSGIASADSPRPVSADDVIAGKVEPGTVVTTPLVDHALLGRTITLQGEVRGIAAGTGSAFATLADDEGEAIIEVPADAAASITAGSRWRATGEVAWSDRRSQLVVKVAAAADISPAP
jgi:DNA/RNA endonuclease YhcR with UshA esterase domain